MSAQKDLATILGVPAASAEKVEPLLADAASALADVKVPSESEIHEMVSGVYRMQQNESLESEDTDRSLEEAMKNVSRWRETTQVYLNGAAVLLLRAAPTLGRYEAKKRVLRGFRALHPTPASERFYFTREKGVELAPELASTAPLESPPVKGAAFLAHPVFAALVGKKPEALDEKERDMLVRLLSIPTDPRSKDATRIVELLARCGDKVGTSVLRALGRPEDCAKSAGGETNELLIGVRNLIPRLSSSLCERILRAALEAGWVEWIDRPLLEPPLPGPLRERLLKEFGSRQDASGNPYRPTDLWFYNLDA
jgi:hypothetical protein